MCFSLVFITIGIAWTNYLAVFCNVYICLVYLSRKLSLQSVSQGASARTLAVLDVDRWKYLFDVKNTYWYTGVVGGICSSQELDWG